MGPSSTALDSNGDDFFMFP